jgi:surface antigen
MRVGRPECGASNRVTCMKIQVAFVAATIALSGCSTIGLGGGRAATPAASGPVTPAAPETIISAMDGGLIGGTIGSGLRESDRRTALQAEYKALEYTPAGNAVEWQGSAGNLGGAVTAAQPYRVGSQDCRQYTHTVTASGQKRTARGTACRNRDGSWTPLT